MASKKSKPEAKSFSRTSPEPATIPFVRRRQLHQAIIFLLGVALYANTFSHGFILDDNMMIAQNTLTKQGIAGIPGIFSSDMVLGNVGKDQSNDIVAGGRYRPVSVAMFAVIYQFAGNNPVPYHVVVVLLFALTCVVLYRIALRLFGQTDTGVVGALLAAVLFAVHPVHTEVVNNVKSCDETLSLLFCLTAAGLALRAFSEGRRKWAWLAGLSFLFASFSKENAVAFTLLIPLALWVQASVGKQPISWKAVLNISLPVWGAFLIFLVARGAVLQWSLGAEKMNLINNSFIKWEGGQWVPFSIGEKFATILYTLGKYLLLMVFPHPLTSDYYPRHIAIHHFGEPVVLLSLLLNAGLFLYAAVGLLKGQRDAIRFGIFFYFASLFIVSNIPFAIGTNMAERFIFMPSAGLCLAGAGLMCAAIARNVLPAKAAYAGFAVLCLAAAAKTLARNPDFASNLKLYRADIEVSDNSARLQYGYAALLIAEAMKEKDAAKKSALLDGTLPHLDKALEINPTYAEAYYTRGSAHFLKNNLAAAIADYEKSLSLVPGRPEVTNNLAAATLEAGKALIRQGTDFEKAVYFLEYSNKLFPNNAETLRYLDLARQRKQQ